MARDPRTDPQHGDTCTLADGTSYRIVLRLGDYIDYNFGGMTLRQWSTDLAERGGVYQADIQHDDALDALNRAADPLGAFYHSVFVTAVEGGVKYWATITRYKWRTKAKRADGEVVYVDDLRGFSAEVVDDIEAEDAEAAGKGKGAPPRTLNRRVITRGCRALAKLDTAAGRAMAKALAAKDAGEVDADVADQAVQIGFFGEVVYG